jgi:DNA-binding NarL/FixJ family response regulator
MSDTEMTARSDYGLTKRQMDVLWLMACGYNNNEISRELGISLNTVQKHAISIYHTMGVQDRAQAIIYALMHNLVHVEDAYEVMAQRLEGVTP